MICVREYDVANSKQHIEKEWKREAACPFMRPEQHICTTAISVLAYGNCCFDLAVRFCLVEREKKTVHNISFAHRYEMFQIQSTWIGLHSTTAHLTCVSHLTAVHIVSAICDVSPRTGVKRRTFDYCLRCDAMQYDAPTKQNASHFQEKHNSKFKFEFRNILLTYILHRRTTTTTTTNPLIFT